MADRKISEFVEGGLYEDGDIIAAVRSGINTKISLGTASTLNIEDFATSAQGSLADSAIQPDDLNDGAYLEISTQTQAEEGTDNNTIMTPRRVKESIIVSSFAPSTDFTDIDTTGLVTNSIIDAVETGYITIRCAVTSSGGFVALRNNTRYIESFGYINVNSSALPIFVPVKKGDKVQIQFGGSGATLSRLRNTHADFVQFES